MGSRFIYVAKKYTRTHKKSFIYWQNFPKGKFLILIFEIEVILKAFNYQKVRKNINIFQNFI